jgi:uncharacterized delta-60 repeat protein
MPDGDIVLAGYAELHGYVDTVLVRYTGGGRLDPTFGHGGKVITDLFTGDDQARDVVAQPDGKVIAGGHACPGGPTGCPLALARYTRNGELDITFSDDRKATVRIGEEGTVEALAIQPDGGIVVAGHADAGQANVFALARFTSSGLLDRRFGHEGTVTTAFGTIQDIAHGVVVQSDGKIVAVGQTLFEGLERDFALARYTSAGRLDPMFGDGGKVITDFPRQTDIAYDVAIQRDGKIVAGGGSGDDMALARYLS